MARIATHKEVAEARDERRQNLLAANRFLSKKIRKKTKIWNLNTTNSELDDLVRLASVKKEIAMQKTFDNN